MVTRPLRPPARAIDITLRRPSPLLLVTLVVLLLTGCAGEPGTKVALGPLPVPSPPPPPPPVVEPVAGTIEVITDDASWNDQLGVAHDGAPAEGSVEHATQSVAAALDSFLDSAQVGQPELAHLRGVWLRDAAPDAAAVLESGLTDADNPVAAASYLMRVLLEPNPTLVTTNVQVRRRDGTSVKVEMVFDVSGKQPTLHLVGAPEVL